MTDHETDTDTDDRERPSPNVEVVVVPENDRAEALAELPDDELEAVFLRVAEEVARRKSGRW